MQLSAPNLIQAIPADKVRYIVPEQVCHLTSNQVVRIKGEEQFVERVAADKVRSLAKDYFKWLKTPAQINEIPIEHLQPVQVPSLKNEKLMQLTAPNLIQAIPVDKVRYIVPEQVCHLTSSQVVHIKGEEQFVERVAADKVKSLAKDYFKWLKTPAQINEIPIEHLQPDQVPSLKNEKLMQLTAPNLIQAVPTNKVSTLEPKQVPHFSNLQLGVLEESQLIEAVSLDKIRFLNHVETLPIDKIWYINAEAHRDLSFGKKLYAALYFPVAVLHATLAAVCTALLCMIGIFFYLSQNARASLTRPISHPKHLVKWYFGTTWPIVK